MKPGIDSKRIPLPTCPQIGKSEAVIGVVDNKRRGELTLNFRDGLSASPMRSKSKFRRKLFSARNSAGIRILLGGDHGETKGRADSARATGARGSAGRHKTGGSTRRVSKSGGKRPGVTRKKGSAKQRKELRTRNVGKGRVRGRQTGGGGKASSFTARPIGRTLGVALPGESAPPGERGAWEFGKAKPS